MSEILIFEDDMFRNRNISSVGIDISVGTSNVFISKNNLSATAIGPNSPYSSNVSGVLVFKDLINSDFFTFTIGLSSVWVDHKLPLFNNVAGITGGVMSQTGTTTISKSLLASGNISLIDNFTNIQVNLSSTLVGMTAGSFISISGNRITRTNEKSMISVVSGFNVKSIPSFTWVSFGLTSVNVGDTYAVNFTLLNSGTIRCLHPIPKTYLINVSAQPDANSNAILQASVGINGVIVNSSITQKREVGASAGQNRPSVECTTLREMKYNDNLLVYMYSNSAEVITLSANVCITDT